MTYINAYNTHTHTDKQKATHTHTSHPHTHTHKSTHLPAESNDDEEDAARPHAVKGRCGPFQDQPQDPASPHKR
jgi:hypothetical protein